MNDAFFLSFVLQSNPDIIGIITTKRFYSSRNLFNRTLNIIKNKDINNIPLQVKMSDKFEFQLKNGSRLLAIPFNNGNNLHGLRADFVFTDFKKDSKEMREFIYPLMFSLYINTNPRFIYSFSSNNESLLII